MGRLHVTARGGLAVLPASQSAIHVRPQTRAHTGSASATAIALGWTHTCALVTGGTIKCWGYNGNGQLGIGSTADQLRPVDVDLGTGAYACLRVGERGLPVMFACNYMRIISGSPRLCGGGGGSLAGMAQ